MPILAKYSAWPWCPALVCLTSLLLGPGCGTRPAPAPAAKVQGAGDHQPEGEQFRDMAAQAGIDFTYRNGEETDHYAILESLGGGVALIDYDQDGLLDVFFTGGGCFDGPGQTALKGHPSRLYRNLGGWKFQDVTAAVGLDGPLFYTHGCAVADYDRDGWPDLLVTGWGRVVLYHNEPIDPAQPHLGRRFVDVTAKVGIQDRLWSTSAGWGDLDGDGYPDLYVCHYVDWSLANNPPCLGYSAGIPRDVCPPGKFRGLPHVVYRNHAGQSFSDVSAQVGLRQGGDKTDEAGKGLGVVVADLNGDGRPDIYVANDTTNNFLYCNRGGWKFEELGLLKGVALDDRGQPQGSMGVDVGDYDGSGLASLFITNYQNEMHALYRNLGSNEHFLFSTPAAGIAAIGQRYVGFGTCFVDYDHDGWLDLAISNGHVIRHPVQAGLKQKPVLFRNQGLGRFVEAARRGGPYFRSGHRGRGLAVGDLDNDGWPDLVISHVNEPVVLLRNLGGEAAQPVHWLGVRLAGRDRRDLAGARLTLEVAGKKLTRFIKGGGSYLSASDPRVLFGLADATAVERLSVDWPWGQRQHWEGAALATNRYWRLIEGEKKPR